MKKLIPVIAMLLMLQTQNAMAHAGGHGPVSPEMAAAIALDAAGQFTSFDPDLGFGMLSSSWKGLANEAAKIETRGNGYYIVSVVNQAEGKTLYILMSTSGGIYDANFTGEFPKVK
jgi:hypothetical protein